MKRLGLFFMALFFGLLTFNHQVIKAAENYDITHFNQTIKIDSTGNAQVNYQITYHFDDDMHGFFVSQGLQNGQSVGTQVTARVNGQQLEKYTGETTGLEILNKDSNKVFKLHYPVKEDHTYNIELTYPLKDFVKRYTDVAVINQAIIPQNWDVDLNDVNLEVILPRGQQQKFATYTNSFVDAKFVGNAQKGIYRLHAKVIPANEIVELHAYFDQATIPSAKQINAVMAQKIKRQQKQLAIKKGQAKKSAFFYQRVTWMLSGIAVLLVISARLYYVKKRNAALKIVDELNNYDLPSQLMPAVVLAQLKGRRLNRDDAFNATIMDLTARKYLQLEPIPGANLNVSKKKQANQLQFRLIKYDAELTNFENTVLTVLFGRLQSNVKGSIVKVKALSADKGAVIKRYTDNIDNFSRQIRDFADEYKLTDNKSQSTFDGLKMLAVGIATIAAIWDGLLIATNNFLQPNMQTMLPLIIIITIVGVLFIYAIKVTIVYLPDKWETAQAWNNFRNMLKNIGEFDIKQVTDVALWDRYLAYAIALGVGKEASDALAKYLPADSGGLNTQSIALYAAFSMINNSDSGLFNTGGGSSSNVASFSSGGSGSTGGGGAF